MWFTQATHNRFTDPGATGHLSLSTTLQAASSVIRVNRFRSALAMLLLRLLEVRRLLGVRRLLRSHRNN